jgi:hypothetical protein
MSLRVGFDLDGVLADLDAAIAREAVVLFPRKGGGVNESPVDGARTEAIAELDGRPGRRRRRSSRDQKRLWAHVARIHNFWETLDEVEEGAVARLAEVATQRRWEVIFLTKRPQTDGSTAQLQTQRWLASKGFPLPSVCVVQNSRGAIATALGLQAVVDDRLENCLDVIADSDARVFLRCASMDKPPAARRIAIQPVTSMAMCLEQLVAVELRPSAAVAVVHHPAVQLA